ncbi:MAG: hypothetical protein R3F24_10285 [Gammaproteobacteria bacterium]
MKQLRSRSPANQLVSGVPCAVVRDIVTEDEAVIEDTVDWFAQDLQGNVGIAAKPCRTLKMANW